MKSDWRRYLRNVAEPLMQRAGRLPAISISFGDMQPSPT